MEVQFPEEVAQLHLVAGATLHGEGILATTKALLESSVSYGGGFQGAPVSHLLDVMVRARPYLDELGVQVEACANEASAAAMLGGALIVSGEDHGEGASVTQERTQAFAMKGTLLVLNITYPMVPQQIADFCSPRQAVMVLEEGMPEYIEKDISAALRRADVARALGTALPPRPPNVCVGCPERPVFSALKLTQTAVGPVHVAADIGCPAFAAFEPFSSGHSILGYGMRLASRDVVSPLIMKNGYTSTTGTQDIISTPDDEVKAVAVDKQQSLVHQNQTIEATLKGLGVQWLRSVDNCDVAAMRRTLEAAFTSDVTGLKVIIAEGECQLERQRRVKPWIAGLLQRGQRVARVKYGVDEDVCTGDHACIRLGGCPTLTLKDNPDPAEGRPGGHRDRRLRRLRRLQPVRRQRPCRHAVPRLLQGRADPQSEVARALDRWFAGMVCGPRCGVCCNPPDARHTLSDQPVTSLISVLGGEGGGVLADWLVDTDRHGGHAVQGTSIPGVAQRTGATPFYIEHFPRPIVELAGREPWALPLAIPSRSVFGLLALRTLASLRGQRRRGSRFAADQTLIEHWLAGVQQGLGDGAALGLEIARCGRLIKGYGSTNERGKHNLLPVVDHPARAGTAGDTAQRAKAVAAVREAALADDTGSRLHQTLIAHGAPPRPVVAQPIRWHRRRPVEAGKVPTA